MTNRTRKKAILYSACLGAFFDGFDASLYLIVLYPCISELIHNQSHAQVGPVGGTVLAIFMLGWALGALVFGILCDRVGRIRTMTFTIFLYALSTAMCACVQSWQELAFCRFLAGCGIGGEQGAGAILISEVSKGSKRYSGLGLMTAAISAGYLFSSIVNLFLGHIGWRYVFLCGLLPAGLTFYVRSKLKELEPQVQEQIPNWTHALKSVLTEHTRNIIVVLCLASAAIINWWAVLSWIPAWVSQMTGGLAVTERSLTTMSVFLGAMLICLPGSRLLQKLGRRKTLALAFAGAFVTDLLMFGLVKSYGLMLLFLAFFVGAFAALPFLCLFTIVPELFPRSIRGTSFGISIQTGRVFAALAAITGGQIISAFHGSYPCAASLLASFNMVGVVAALFVPEHENYLSLEESFRRVEAPSP